MYKIYVAWVKYTLYFLYCTEQPDCIPGRSERLFTDSILILGPNTQFLSDLGILGIPGKTGIPGVRSMDPDVCLYQLIQVAKFATNAITQVME